MEKFTRLEGAAVFMPEKNIDTDIIYPARFLLLMDRGGLGPYAFYDKRFRADGGENADFVLNRPNGRIAKILIAGANFGCGSSREQAVWALAGYGLRCVIAPSFGDIFFNNCSKNGVLAIRLPAETVDFLGARADASVAFTVDLTAQSIEPAGLPPIPFAIAPELKSDLLNGWDETDRILGLEGDKIAAFEDRHRDAQPWLFR